MHRIIGISFCLIIVRMSQNGDNTGTGANSAPHSSGGRTYPLQNVAISVDRTVDNHIDMEDGSLVDCKARQLSAY